MKMDTRQKILDIARTLFNEYGYNGVSLRDIAKAAGISEGNLTYHFKKKENLIECLLSEEKDTFPISIPKTLEELDAVFLDMQQKVQKNLYFFLHYTQLSQTSPEICYKQSSRYSELLEKLRSAFQNLYEAGLLRREIFSGEYGHVIDTLYMSIIYWAPFMELKKSIHTDNAEYRRFAWYSMYHLLTEKGQSKLQNIVKIQTEDINAEM